MTDSFFIQRPAEAASLARLLDPDPFFGEMSGLFLAAPRRTGKSTFLRRDLKPLLEEQGKIVLYVDLWSDRDGNPGQLITGAITSGLQAHDGAIAKFRRGAPFTAIGAFGFRIDLKASGPWEGTISDALSLLVEATERDVVLIVDEAQHSLVTKEGTNAMFALKAARDAINQSDLPGKLYLVMTGSHRDKLTALVHDHQAPFFGARVRDFPPLGRDYSEMITAHVNSRLAQDAQLSVDDVERVFDMLGRRPEGLNACLREMFLSEDFSGEALQRLAQADLAASRAQITSAIESLTDLQQAILRQMAEDGLGFAPFTEETRRALSGDDEPIPYTSVQKALDALRRKDLVWRPSVGVYLLNDSEIAHALRAGDGAAGA